MSLNDTAVKALKPKATRYKVFDGEGLYIEVLPSGVKVWRVKMTHEGKDKRVTLGRYPSVTLKDARTMLQGLRRGDIPMSAVRKDQDASFMAVALEWVSRKETVWSPGHRGTVLYRLDRFVFTFIGQKQIKDITPFDVLELVRVIESAGKNHTAHRVLGICSQVFRYGVATGKCPSDPCRDLSGALTSYAEKPRAAIIRPKEAGALMLRIMGYRQPGMRYLLLWSAYTFCRPGEVRQAEWSEIDWDAREWRIPAGKMKMRFEHRVPLARQCMELLERIQKNKTSPRWIFPSRKKREMPVSEAGAISAIRSMGYGKDEMTPHGFRAMASTLLHELGYKPDIIERQLAHGELNKVRAVYNRAAYMDERRTMMQEWADYLDGLAEQARNRLEQTDMPG